MAKRKTSKAAPLRATGTRSRTPAPEQRCFQIEKLGKVYRWDVPESPHAGEPNLRAAFVGGFRARSEAVNNDQLELGVPLRFIEGSNEQQAFTDGYHAAANQDGLYQAPKRLTGSKSKRSAKRR
jgi:hypothetical protein